MKGTFNYNKNETINNEQNCTKRETLIRLEIQGKQDTARLRDHKIYGYEEV